MPYDNKQIAKELIATALGNAYHGNALYVAKDIPALAFEERAVLYRWLDGSQRETDHLRLQEIALKISADHENLPMAPTLLELSGSVRPFCGADRHTASWDAGRSNGFACAQQRISSGKY